MMRISVYWKSGVASVAGRTALACLLLSVAAASSGSVLRVKAGSTAPTPDGLSWETAFPTLEAACGAAFSGDEIWVASGSYAGSLALTQEVAYYGGFAGTEVERFERNPADRSAILTKPVELRALPEERPDRVTLLDGFRITAGLQLAIRTSLDVRNCDIERQSLVIVENGISGKSVDVADCTFDGAGLEQSAGSPETGYHIARCQVTRGSLILGSNAGGFTVEDCSLAGGDIDLFSGKSVHVLRNRVVGGMIIAQSADDLRVESNRVEFGGGMAVLGAATTSVIGCVSNNVVAFCCPFTTAYGGLFAFHSLDVTGNTVAGCRAPEGAFIVGAQGPAVPNVANNLVAFNDGPGVVGAGFGNEWAANCVFGNTGGNYANSDDPTGTKGNISADPLFANLSLGDWHLSPLSPCRDAGATPVAGGSWDIDGQPRTQRGIVDIGADETDFGWTWHVRPTAPGPHDGRSWETAFTDITDAVQASSPLDVIRVASHLYAYALPLELRQGTALVGGYASETASLGQRDITRYMTTIKGGLSLEGLSTSHPEWTTVLDGFLLQEGAIDATAQTSVTLARCMFHQHPLEVNGGSSAAFLASECEFTGGGPYARADGFGHCVFEESRFDAAGPWAGGANAIVRDCLVDGGSIEVRSSGLAWAQRNTVTRGSITVYSAGWTQPNCLADGNEVIDYLPQGLAVEAAILVVGSGTVSNNMVRHATLDVGAAIGITHAIDSNLVGNTVTGCLNVGAGSAYHVVAAGHAVLGNNIAAHNMSNGIVIEGSETTSVAYRSNCFHQAAYYGIATDPTGANGNIDADPLLDAEGRLTAASPCLDAGNSADAAGDADVDGDPRVLGASVDIGADEYVPGPFAAQDVVRALRISAGVTAALPGDLRRLDVVDESVAAKRIRLNDAIAIARKVAGLEPNP